jgi:oligopeptide transport system substrate-binding protein
VPLWDYINAAGHSPAVHDVTIRWNGLPDYESLSRN